MSRRLRSIAIGSMIVVVFAGWGTQRPGGEVVSQDAPASPGDAVAFAHGYIPGLNHLPEVIAEQHAAEFGLDLETVNFTTVPDTVTALSRGDIDLMINTPSTVIVGRDQGLPLVQVGGGYWRGTSIVLSNDLPIEPGDWEALSAAVEEANDAGEPLQIGAAASVSTNWIECYFSMQMNGVDPEHVEVVNIPAPTEHPGALGRGDVDMLCTWEPFSTLAQTIGDGSWFAYPFDTPAGESLGGLVVTEEAIADPERHEAIQRYISLFDFAVDQLNGDPELAVQTAMDVMRSDNRRLAESALAATKFDVGFDIDEVTALAGMHFELGQTNEDWSTQVDAWTDDEFVNALE